MTDDWDRRCLMSILSRCLTPEVLNADYSFSSSGIYKPAPGANGGDYSSVMEYFSDLPQNGKIRLTRISRYIDND